MDLDLDFDSESSDSNATVDLEFRPDGEIFVVDNNVILVRDSSDHEAINDENLVSDSSSESREEEYINDENLVNDSSSESSEEEYINGGRPKRLISVGHVDNNGELLTVYAPDFFNYQWVDNGQGVRIVQYNDDDGDIIKYLENHPTVHFVAKRVKQVGSYLRNEQVPQHRPMLDRLEALWTMRTYQDRPDILGQVAIQLEDEQFITLTPARFQLLAFDVESKLIYHLVAQQVSGVTYYTVFEKEVALTDRERSVLRAYFNTIVDQVNCIVATEKCEIIVNGEEFFGNHHGLYLKILLCRYAV